MMLLLLKLFGVRRVAGWALRLIKIVLWLGLLTGLGLVLWLGGEQAFERMLAYGAVGLVILGIQALWRWRRRRKGPASDAPHGERTIDGKVVPDMLAASALGIPQRSPDGEYVLRGLPDYGKALLKLDASEFGYLPEPAERTPLFLPVEEPAVERSPLVALRWVLGAVAVVCFVVAGLVIQSARSDVRRDRASIQDMPENPQPVSAAETAPDTASPLLTLTPPPASEATSETTPSPAPVVDSAPVIAAASRPSDDPAETWRDPSTGLLWPTRDNGEPIVSLIGAKSHCGLLTWHNLAGWRLPSYREQWTLWDKDGTLRGGIKPSGEDVFYWSTTVKRNTITGEDESTALSVVKPGKLHREAGVNLEGGTWKDDARVLCVHD